MLPTVRSLVSVPAGLLKMRFKTFFIASTIGTAGWTAMLAFAGFKLGENFADIDDLLGPASNAILVVLVVGYIYRVWTHRDIDPDDARHARSATATSRRSRVRVAIDVEQPRGVDLGVDLGRRQAGMAEQFLERAQVRAAGEQMRREAVAQRVRRDAVGQPERDPRRRAPRAARGRR